MAKRSKSDLVGNLINKRKMLDNLPEESVSVIQNEQKENVEKVIEPQVKSEKKVVTKPSSKRQAPKKKALGEVGSILSDLKEDKKQDKYASIKIKTLLYNRIKKIARKEGIDRHGHLIDRVLTDFCDRYEEK